MGRNSYFAFDNSYYCGMFILGTDHSENYEKINGVVVKNEIKYSKIFNYFEKYENYENNGINFKNLGHNIKTIIEDFIEKQLIKRDESYENPYKGYLQFSNVFIKKYDTKTERFGKEYGIGNHPDYLSNLRRG